MKEINSFLEEIDISNLDNIEIIESNDIEKSKAKRFMKGIFKSEKKGKYKVFKRTSIAVALMIVVLGSVTISNPAMAKELPIIGGLIDRILINSNGEYMNYLEAKNQTISIDGVDLRLESVMVAGDDLYVNLIVKNNNREITMVDYPDILTIGGFIKINGQDVGTEGLTNSYQIIDSNTMLVSNKIRLGAEIKGVMDFEILVNKIMEAKGDFSLKFSYDTAKNKTTKKTAHPNITYGDDVKVKIKKIEATPFDVEISYDIINSPKGFMDARILIFDDKGRILNDAGGEGEDNKWISKYTAKGEINSLTLVPIIYTKEELNDNGTIEMSQHEKTPFETIELDLDKKENLKIDIDKETGRYIEVDDYFRDGDFVILKYRPFIFGMNTSGYWTGDYAMVKQTEENYEMKRAEEYSDMSNNYIVELGKVKGNNKFEVDIYNGSQMFDMKNAITVDLK